MQCSLSPPWVHPECTNLSGPQRLPPAAGRSLTQVKKLGTLPRLPQTTVTKSTTLVRLHPTPLHDTCTCPFHCHQSSQHNRFRFRKNTKISKCRAQDIDPITAEHLVLGVTTQIEAPAPQTSNATVVSACLPPPPAPWRPKLYCRYGGSLPLTPPLKIKRKANTTHLPLEKKTNRFFESPPPPLRTSENESKRNAQNNHAAFPARKQVLK